MSNDLEKAVRSLEARAKLARDNMSHHQSRIEFHVGKRDEFKAEAHGYEAAIKALGETMREIGSEPSREPVEEAVPEDPADPFRDAGPRKATNGPGEEVPFIDRAGLRRLLHTNRVRYPVASSHRRPKALEKQFLIAAAMRHPGYEDAVKNGAPDLQDVYHRTHQEIEVVVERLGINREEVARHARRVHRIIYTHGVEGVDYL